MISLPSCFFLKTMPRARLLFRRREKLLTGIDVIEVHRIERALTRPRNGDRLLNRVVTAAEVAYCESRGKPRYQSYAARFVAKEAAMKAMGTGWNRNVGWAEIEVVRERGK